MILPQRVEAPEPVLVPKHGLQAPIAKGDTVATDRAAPAGGDVVSAPVVAAAAMKRETIFQAIGRMFGGLSGSRDAAPRA